MMNVNLLCTVYLSISTAYLNSKFGILRKIFCFFFISYSQRYAFAFYVV